MQAPYQVGRITDRRIDQSYPMISALAPTLGLDDWRSFCRSVLRSGPRFADEHDVVVATNPPGYIQGLSISAVRHHPAHGRILDAPVFIVASAADEMGVAAALLLHMKGRAMIEHCSAIRIWSLNEGSWSRQLPAAEIRRDDDGMLIPMDHHSAPAH